MTSEEAVQWIQALFMVGSLIMIGFALMRLSDLKEWYGTLLTKLGKMHDFLGEVSIELSKVKADVNRRPAGLFTVLVVGQHKDGTPFVWGISDIIAWHEEKQIQIPLQAVLKKGAVIVCIGEAELREVLCGNVAQTPWLNGGSPMCFTQEDIQMGVHITARVRSNRA